MNDERGEPRAGWWPGNALGLDGNYLAGALGASGAIAIVAALAFGIGPGELIGGWAFLLLLMCSSRAFQFSLHQTAENARAAVAEDTGRPVPNTNPLPRAFHEPRPEDAERAKPAHAPTIVATPPRRRQSVPTVSRHP
ncbi:MAG: hypothetical protein FJX36_15455 [Alphaproteobacteria bacterium]|nr:hypothetical protein [Alphaproteobacteria bacterium]